MPFGAPTPSFILEGGVAIGCTREEGNLLDRSPGSSSARRRRAAPCGPIVEQEHVEAGQPAEQTAQTTVGTCQAQIAKQLGGSRVEGGESIPAGFLG